MALTFKVKPADPKPYTILDALEEFLLPKEKRTLMLISVKTGVGYKVLAYDKKTGVVRLHTGYKKQTLNPVVTEREALLYRPLWR